MPGLWRHKIELPRHWRIILTSIEVGGPLALSILPYGWGKGADSDYWIIRAVFGIAVLTFVSVLILRIFEWFGTHNKKFVDSLLTHLGDTIWEKAPEKLVGPIERHRITLFQARRRFWLLKKFQPKWTHTLCPRTRTPSSSRRPRRKFKVHEHYVEDCEGVAGLVFSNGQKSLVSPQLPDLHADDVPRTAYADYASKTNDTLDMVKREKYYSQVIGGVTIYKDGDRWGVLILDSVDPNALIDGTLDGIAVKRTLALLIDVLS